MARFIIEWRGRDLVADEGVGIAHSVFPSIMTLDQCKKTCDETDGCNSIAWNMLNNTERCFLKQKCLTEDEPSNPSKDKLDFKSYFKPCTSPGICILIHVPEYLYIID